MSPLLQLADEGSTEAGWPTRAPAKNSSAELPAPGSDEEAER